MELKGEYRIPAPREEVWALLNDPDVLRDCIPGCEALEANDGEGFSARVTTKIGPVKATFTGSVALSNINPPESYTISGEGKGGVAGFAKGGADVHLAEDGAGTILTYTANAQVGGKLAQLGSRLIDSTAKKLADQFFACFAARASGDAAPLAGIAEEPTRAETGLAAMPGEPLPPAASGVPLMDEQILAAGVAPVAPTRPEATPMHHGTAAEVQSPARTADHSPGHLVEEVAHELEDEVERKAAIGFLGGPMVWGLLVLVAIILYLIFAT